MCACDAYVTKVSLIHDQSPAESKVTERPESFLSLGGNSPARVSTGRRFRTTEEGVTRDNHWHRSCSSLYSGAAMSLPPEGRRDHHGDSVTKSRNRVGDGD